MELGGRKRGREEVGEGRSGKKTGGERNESGKREKQVRVREGVGEGIMRGKRGGCRITITKKLKRTDLQINMTDTEKKKADTISRYRVVFNFGRQIPP